MTEENDETAVDPNNQKFIVQGEWDHEADAMYLTLTEPSDGKVWGNLMVEDDRIPGYVVFDFDKDDKIVGIEIISALGVLGRDLTA
ncbi:DUF2283 domain-containing protein [Glaciihabitans sp. UYNi722]|uniref:DUF2283 domain-containing protein n=1 Tax=Glaciihabitans sp. UYNi722 TaxID=3156344 RepID=UPI003397777C